MLGTLDAPVERWRKKGASGHRHMLDDESYERGTSGARRKPRKAAKASGLVFNPNAFIDEVLDAAGVEHAHPHDGGQPHRWGEGDTLCLHIGRKGVIARVVMAFDLFGRLRYRLHFVEQDVTFALTEGQVAKLLKPKPQLSRMVIEDVEACLEMVALKRGSSRLDIRQRQGISAPPSVGAVCRVDFTRYRLLQMLAHEQVAI